MKNSKKEFSKRNLRTMCLSIFATLVLGTVGFVACKHDPLEAKQSTDQVLAWGVLFPENTTFEKKDGQTVFKLDKDIVIKGKDMETGELLSFAGGSVTCAHTSEGGECMPLKAQKAIAYATKSENPCKTCVSSASIQNSAGRKIREGIAFQRINVSSMIELIAFNPVFPLWEYDDIAKLEFVDEAFLAKPEVQAGLDEFLKMVYPNGVPNYLANPQANLMDDYVVAAISVRGRLAYAIVPESFRSELALYFPITTNRGLGATCTGTCTKGKCTLNNFGLFLVYCEGCALNF
ncbi:MAG: hypothetical protein EAZ67_04290 [Cytophagales bacterium]|nr:MAG: hypothetical protein EAZ67_04290 [Cytophagales bacterium]